MPWFLIRVPSPALSSAPVEEEGTFFDEFKGTEAETFGRRVGLPAGDAGVRGEGRPGQQHQQQGEVEERTKTFHVRKKAIIS